MSKLNELTQAIINEEPNERINIQIKKGAEFLNKFIKWTREKVQEIKSKGTIMCVSTSDDSEHAGEVKISYSAYEGGMVHVKLITTQKGEMYNE